MPGILEECEGFDWDVGNSQKNWHLHQITDGECEEIFFNMPLLVKRTGSRATEERYFALGRTDSDRRLFAAFTIRDKLIRVISARDMTKSEDRKYAEKVKRDS